MKLIVGIGNYGSNYDNTIHNFGFMAIDYLLNAFNIDTSKAQKKFQGLIWEIFLDSKKILFAKPLTYVNNTIFFLASVMSFYKISLDNVLIIYDDITLTKWKIFVKDHGSGNFHQGMENIIAVLKTKNIKRIKIGALNIFDDSRKIKEKVLSKLPPTTIKNNFPFEDVKIAVELFLNNQFDLAKQKYH